MASIRKLPSGKWNAQIRRQGCSPISKSFLYKDDAERWVRQAESEIERGTYIDRSDTETTTLGEALKRYSAEITPRKKGAEEECWRIAKWLKHPLAKRSFAILKPSDFASYRDVRLRVASGSTVRLELAIISHLYTIALKEWGMPVTNPIQSIRKPAPGKPRSQRLSPTVLDGLLSSCKQSSNHQLHPLVVLAIETGMRLGELMKTVNQRANLTIFQRPILTSGIWDSN